MKIKVEQDSKTESIPISIECEHLDIEWGDDDERGLCKTCGKVCDWHWEKEIIDNYPDSVEEVDVRVPHEWHSNESEATVGEEG